MYNLNEDYEQTLSKLSDGERALVDAAAAIASAPQPKSTEDYAPAAISCTLTHGPGGANFNGWLSYTDGRRVPFTAIEFTRRVGLPLAVAGAMPMGAALKPEHIVGRTGTFIAAGRHGGGLLSMWVDGRPVYIPFVPLAGAGLFDWVIEGVVRFGD